MTDIEKKAREYAEAMCPLEDFFSGDYIDLETRNNELQIHRDDAMQVLEWLTKTHCIVSRELILSQHAWYMQRMKEVSSARQTNRAKAIALEAAFGIDMFDPLPKKTAAQ